MIPGAIGFTAPWLLLALAALPVLWILLRAVPPAPIRRRFPGVALLLGLRDDDSVTDRTPWWLLLLRMLAVAAVIVGLAGPVLNPRADGADAPRGPLLIVQDASWASARDWPAQIGLLDPFWPRPGAPRARSRSCASRSPNRPSFAPPRTGAAASPVLSPRPSRRPPP